MSHIGADFEITLSDKDLINRNKLQMAYFMVLQFFGAYINFAAFNIAWYEKLF